MRSLIEMLSSLSLSLSLSHNSRTLLSALLRYAYVILQYLRCCPQVCECENM